MQTTLIISGIVLAGFVIARMIIMRRIKKTPVVADSDKVLILSDQNFQQQLKNRVVLVDFWAAWCAPCRMMAPVLNDVAVQLNGNTFVGKVDVEKFQSLAGKYKIRSIPTMILFKNGIEITRFVGIKSKDFLLKQISGVN